MYYRGVALWRPITLKTGADGPLYDTQEEAAAQQDRQQGPAENTDSTRNTVLNNELHPRKHRLHSLIDDPSTAMKHHKRNTRFPNVGKYLELAYLVRSIFNLNRPRHPKQHDKSCVRIHYVPLTRVSGCGNTHTRYILCLAYPAKNVQVSGTQHKETVRAFLHTAVNQ